MSWVGEISFGYKNQAYVSIVHYRKYSCREKELRSRDGRKPNCDVGVGGGLKSIRPQ